MAKILIIAPNWIGDAVMTEPLITQLKKNHPDSVIDVIATPWVASVMRAIPAINEVIIGDFKHGLLQWAERKKLASQLKLAGYTHSYVLPNSFKSALIPWLAKIPNRIGYKGEMRWGLITAPLENPSRSNRPSMSTHYFALSGNQANDTLQPKLELPRLFLNEMKEKLQLIQNHDKLFILCPGAEYGPAKQWPTEHFGKLAQMLVEQNNNALVLILGSKKESSLADEIVKLSNSSNQVINWCGHTTLDEAMACIAIADKVISNDSGLMHIAAAFRRPQVAIFGSSDPRHTPPLSPEAKVHWLQLKCSPCFKRTCPLGHLKCLVDIQPQDVLNSLNN
ncbi:MAG: lipopolysaccharide heptosyltransferase II [Polynucleobacter victoriensis]|jgi:heptosyltransferase-2|uniref:lipopolysaccharide heptosyltransferase II n=1 Tax=Polynucleobacter victoriensis TaxID=2049319 RepID=A0A212TFX5_9BURK|nr:lipopolysaccharide heptosyltransferase II [Polynucleobacter victoriensis]SNC64716.1 heptosyltransferase-2 [Polynucleobacter victoriensis]